MADPSVFGNTGSGSIFGGTGVSGLLGSLFGYGPSGVSAQNQLAGQGVTGAPQIATGEEEANAAQEGQALQQLQNLASGTGPSAAQSQLSAGLQQSAAQQAALAAGGRYGQNAVLRQRQASETGAGLEAGAANQATQTRAQEQQFGAQAAGSLAGQMRGQSLAGATAQAQLQQDYNQQIANLYGQEQGQQAQAGMQLQNNLLSPGGGVGSLLTGLGGLAHGGVAHSDAGSAIPQLTISPIAATSYTPMPAQGGQPQQKQKTQQKTQTAAQPVDPFNGTGGGIPQGQFVGYAQQGLMPYGSGNVRTYQVGVPPEDSAPSAYDDVGHVAGKQAGGTPFVGDFSASPALAALAAHGAVEGRGTETYIGEKGPELLLPHAGAAKLIDKPGLTRLGIKGEDVVVPLAKGSAPYHPGPLPKSETPMPSKPAPKNVQIQPKAARAMAGDGDTFSPGPGASALSPQTAPIVQQALADHGIHPGLAYAHELLRAHRVKRAMMFAGGMA
jgi:hypothetical protein